MVSRPVTAVVMAAIALSLSACRSEAPEQAEPMTGAESHEGHTMARAYFISPSDGQTLTSPVRFEFGVDQYEIAPVPEGEVTEARPDRGHFHLGVDTECLPAGTVIPKAEDQPTPPGEAGSWIHFGTGSRNIEMSLTPGQHTMSVQVGDDLHRAVEGLCETITITVQ